MSDFSSITRTGKHEPFDLHLARGYIQGHSHVHKFGVATSVSLTEVVVWDGNSDYSYPTSAATLGVVGTSTTDNSQITVQGVDADYNFVSNIVTLNGTTTVTTSDTYLRANRAFVSDDNEPSGDVNIRHSGNLVAQISSGENQTLMAIYTVPAGHTAFMKQLHVGSSTETILQYMTVRLKVRKPGGVFRTHAKYTISDNSMEETFPIPLVFTEKTDIHITAESSSGAAQQVHGLFDLILIKNEST